MFSELELDELKTEELLELKDGLLLEFDVLLELCVDELEIGVLPELELRVALEEGLLLETGFCFLSPFVFASSIVTSSLPVSLSSVSCVSEICPSLTRFPVLAEFSSPLTNITKLFAGVQNARSPFL